MPPVQETKIKCCPFYKMYRGLGECINEIPKAKQGFNCTLYTGLMLRVPETGVEWDNEGSIQRS